MLLSQLNSVDIWFVFGSFVYGFEGQLVSWKQGKLELLVLAAVGPESQGALEFFSELSHSAKGLLKCEIRVFEGTDEAEKPLLTMVSNCAPKVLSLQPDPRIIFSDVRGISDEDERIWNKFSQTISQNT